MKIYRDNNLQKRCLQDIFKTQPTIRLVFIICLNFIFLCFRLELEEAQTALESTKSELSETCQELLLTQTHLKSSDTQLKETEKRLSQISNNR